MKTSHFLFGGLICLFSGSVVAQKLVPHSFRHVAEIPHRAPSERDTLGQGKLRFLTQVKQLNTTFLRLYFAGTQLGENSYLVLEGTDGNRQELRKQDLENWRYSSAYFNGSSVNVSLFSAPGDRNTITVSGVKVSGENTGLTKNARQSAAAASAPSPIPYAQTKAVGRFTNGVETVGTGWIAPNGAIVTSWTIDPHSLYDLIEFNVPPSVGGVVMHPSPQDQYPLHNPKPIGSDGSGRRVIFKEEPEGLGFFFWCKWLVLEPLPNGTGLRPGERQQAYFRIALNPGNFTIDAKGAGNLPVEILHYGDYSGGLPGDPTYRTLQLLETTLWKQNDLISTLTSDRDRFVVYGTPISLHNAWGAPITYAGSNVAIGVHGEERAIIEGVDVPGHGIGFRDEGFRDEVARFYTEKSAYLDADGASDQPNGQVHKPYLTVQQAAQHAPNDYTVYIAKGTYPGAVTFNRPLTLRAPVGEVTIGSANSGARRAAGSAMAREVALTEAMAHSRLDSREESVEKVRAYPNPFREQTQIKYPFAEGRPVSVNILNAAGVSVATFKVSNVASGATGVHWNGTDQNGTPVPAGLYLINVSDGRQTFATKVLKQ
jgi:hypothetical protein